MDYGVQHKWNYDKLIGRKKPQTHIMALYDVLISTNSA